MYKSIFSPLYNKNYKLSYFPPNNFLNNLAKIKELQKFDKVKLLTSTKNCSGFHC